MAFPEASIKQLAIPDVYLIDTEVHVDSRGIVYEVLHASDSFVEQIRQVYHVCNPRANTIRAFHSHQKLHDWFHIVHGSAIFCLVDGRVVAPNKNNSLRLILTARKPQLLVVPPGIYHGWMSLEDNTIMTSVASEEYIREAPDEIRVSPDHFDDLFNGTPWKIDAF